MNEQELIELRERMRAVNNEIMLDFLTSVLQITLRTMPPEFRSQIGHAISEKLAAKKQEYALLPFKGLPPEWADLLSAENHEQFMSVCREIERKLELP
jgi:hypothetical protein